MHTTLVTDVDHAVFGVLLAIYSCLSTLQTEYGSRRARAMFAALVGNVNHAVSGMLFAKQRCLTSRRIKTGPLRAVGMRAYLPYTCDHAVLSMLLAVFLHRLADTVKTRTTSALIVGAEPHP